MAGPDLSGAGTALSNSDIAAAELPMINSLERSDAAAARQGVPVDQLVSPAGAVGRYQVMPSTGALYGYSPDDLRDPDKNRAAATGYLTDLVNRFGTNPGVIAAGYNGGAGRGALAQQGRISETPAETQDYYQRAMGMLRGAADTAGNAIIPAAHAEGTDLSGFGTPVDQGKKPDLSGSGIPLDPKIFPELTPDAPLPQRPAKVAGPSTVDMVKGLMGGTGSDGYNLGDRLIAGAREGLGNVVDTAKAMAGAGVDKAKEIWTAPLDSAPAAPGPLHNIENLTRGAGELVDLGMRGVNTGLQVPAAVLRAQADALAKKVTPAAGFPAGAVSEVMGAIPEGFIGEGGVPHPVEDAAAPRAPVVNEPAPSRVVPAPQVRIEPTAASPLPPKEAVAGAEPAATPVPQGNLAPVHDPETWAQTGWRDEDGNIFPLDQGPVPVVPPEPAAPEPGFTTTPGAIATQHAAEVSALEAEGTKAAVPKPTVPPEVENPPVPAAPQSTTSFTTAKGSTYTVNEDGTTTRDKAARPDRGHEGQQGPQPTSQQTFYVTPEHADQLGLFQAQGASGKMAVVQRTDGTAGVKYVDGPHAGKFEKRTVAPVQTAPAPGLIPVETWKDGTRVHFGNTITEVRQAAPALQNADKSIGNDGKPIESVVTPDQAKAALASNIDPRTSARPKGNAALRTFRAEMQGIIDKPQAIPDVSHVSRESAANEEMQPVPKSAAPEPAVLPDLPHPVREDMAPEEDTGAPGSVQPVVRPEGEGAFNPRSFVERARALVRDRTSALTHTALARRLGIEPDQAARVASALAATPDSGVTMGRNGLRRRSISEGPQDAAAFLAARGGIKDTEGHDLVKGRGLQQMIPGSGPLIRPNGMSIDYAGEALHEAGYFGPPEATPRPSENEVLQLLERTGRDTGGKRTKVYAPADEAAQAETRTGVRAEEENDAMRDEVSGAARGFDENLSPDEIDQIAANMAAHGIDAESAVAEHIERKAMREVQSDHDETGDETYRPIESVAQREGEPDREAGPRRNESEAGPENETGPAEEVEAAPENPAQEKPGATERGAGGLDQTILPGAERSARQLAQARENAGHGRTGSAKEQKAADQGLFAEPDDQTSMFGKRDEAAKPFYSALTRSVEGLKMERAPAEQWRNTIKNLPGLKQEELAWSGLDDFLKEQKGPVTKAAVLQHLRENEVQIKEVEKSAPTHERSEDAHLLYDTPKGQAKYGSYTLPGGKNYRELLMTLPNKIRDENAAAFARSMSAKYGERWIARMDAQEAARYSHLIDESEKPQTKGEYKSSHWDEPNILAHVRFDDRTGPNGEKVLHIAEVQSDWHQAGRRKGYRGELEKRFADLIKERDETPDGPERDHIQGEINTLGRGDVGVPDAPFKTTWHDLAMKRMLRYAAEKGYDRVSWDTGDTSAARYDLSHQINRIEYEATGDGKFEVDVYGKDGKSIQSFRGKEYTPEQVEENFGKDIAQKMTDGTGRDLRAERGGFRDWKSLEGLDLKVGGEGMRGFYDKILPASVNKIAKRFGSKTEDTTVETGGEKTQEYRGPVATSEQMAKAREAITARASDQRFISPITGERQAYQINRVSNMSALRDVEAKMREGASFQDAMTWGGSPDLAKLFGGDMADAKTATSQTAVHSVPVTDAMREGVMQGQSMFAKEDGRGSVPGFEEGPDTKVYRRGPKGLEAEVTYTPRFDAARKALGDDLRKRLDQIGLKDMKLGIPESIHIIKDGKRDGVAGGWLTNRIIHVALDNEDPMHFLNHEAIHGLRREGLINETDWNVLKQKAPDWIKKYDLEKNYDGLTPEQMTEEAIAHAFPDFVKGTLEHPGNAVHRIMRHIAKFFEAVRNALHGNGFRNVDDVFSGIDRGETGKAEPNDFGAAFAKPPEPPPEDHTTPVGRVFGKADRIIGETAEKLGQGLKDTANRIFPESVKEAKDAVQMALAPMTQGSVEARATAKDFANAMRKSRFITGRQIDYLYKNFSAEQLGKMWDAADQESVLRQQDKKPEPTQGLNRLSDKERAAVEAYQAESNALLKQAKDIGLFKGEGLPSYVPRMVVALGADGKYERLKGGGGETAHGLDAIGRNVKTTSANLKQRKYLTKEETEAAAGALAPGAVIVKDFRTLPLAMGRLQEAIAGRTLIDKIREFGREAGDTTVSEGADPGTEPGWFTIDHPAFKTYRPKLLQNKETGKWEMMQDQNGEPIFEKVPLFIRKDFEGPLRAVLSKDSSKIYQAAMKLKGKTMSIVMYSPLMHNAVIWGKAFPAAPLKLLNPLWRDTEGKWHAGIEMYGRGRAAKNDPAQMKQAIDDGLDPIGHRYFNQDISAMMEEPNIKAGRSWTSQLVGSIPGLFDKAAGEKVKTAIDKMGDIWHNKLLWDLVGNLQMGLYTHMKEHAIEQGHDPQTAGRFAAHFANRYGGALPIESMSKAARMTANMMMFSRSFTLTNLGAYKDLVAGLPKDVQAQILRDKGMKALTQIQGTARRKGASLLLADIVLSHVGLILAQHAMSYMFSHAYHAPAQNEPSKEQRFLIGYQKDGTALYGRLPTGKVGEELQDWATSPMDLTKRKLSPFAQAAYGLASNTEGFGRKVYDPYDETATGYLKNAARVGKYLAQTIGPWSPFESAMDIGKGHGDPETNWLKIWAPALGVSISKGAPGGPAVGQLYASKDEHEFQVGEAMPDIRDAIANGDIKTAQKQMTGLGMSRSYQKFIIRTTQNPGARLNKKQVKEFMGYANPEERDRMKMYMNQGSGPDAGEDAPDKHSALEPSDLGSAIRNGTLEKFASAGNTWTRAEAVRAASTAGMPATAALLQGDAENLLGAERAG